MNLWGVKLFEFFVFGVGTCRRISLCSLSSISLKRMLLSRCARPRRTALTVGNDGLRHLDAPVGCDLNEHVLSGQ